MDLFEKEKHSQSNRKRVKDCNVCGSRGFSNALVYCSRCSDTTVHQYCVGIPPGSLDDINSWVCEYCSAVMEPESCTCDAFANASNDRSPETCIVQAEALTMKSTSEIMVIPDQPAVVGALYLVTCKGNSEKEETKSCSQIADEILRTTSISQGDSLDYWEENECSVSSFMEYPESIVYRVVFLVSPSGKVIISRDSASGRSLNYVEEPEAQVSSHMEYPEEISGELVPLLKPSGEIIIHGGVTSFMEYLESIMYRVVFLVSPSGKIIICRRTVFCDEFNAQNVGDSASGHPLNYVEEPEARVFSHMEYPKEVMLVKPSGEIIIHYGVTSHFSGWEAAMHNMANSSNEIHSDFVRKHGPYEVTPDSFSLDEVIDRDEDFAYDCSVEHVDPICVSRKETDVQGDTVFEYLFDASENMEDNIQQSNEALNVDGLPCTTSGYKHCAKRKKTTTCDHLLPLKPCKRARINRCGEDGLRTCHRLQARGSSSCKDASKLEGEEDLIKGEVLPRRSQFKRASRAKVDPTWMTKEWDGKDLRLKPEVHLSARAALEVNDVGARSYGSLTFVMESLGLLSEGARSIILGGALGPVVASWCRVVQLHAQADKVLLRGFLERFWDTTNSFHMPFGEVGITMTDFVMISGLPSSGQRIEFNEDLTLSSEGMGDLLGRHLPQTVYMYHQQVPYSFFESYFRKVEGNMDEATDEQNARVWLWYFLGATFFAEKGSRCSTRYFYLLRDLGALGAHNWAAAAYSNYIWYLRAAVRLKDPDSGSQVGVVGPGHILEAWIFTYFPSLTPTDPADPPRFPAVERWAACRQRRVFHSLNDVRKAINGLTTNEFVARPWVGYEGIPDFVVGSRIMDKTRVLLKGPFGPVWFLGERMARQTTTDRFVVPVDPPVSMFRTARLMIGEAEEAMSGRPMIDFLLSEPDYRKYVARRLAWQVIEVPGVEYLSNFLGQLARLLQR